MREMKHAPHGSHPTGVSETGRGPGPGEPAEGINAFLIADIRGYTMFTQERGDEAAAALTGRFGDIARSLVDQRDGSLIELRGDEALATFRSPRQAIRAAVDLQSRFLEETRSTPDLPLLVGIGLDVGEAASLGGGYRGGALNLAARLCGEAGPGEILASQNLVHLAGAVDGVRYLDHGELHLKGLSDSVHVLQLASEGLDVAGLLKAFVPTRRRQRVFGGKMHFRVLGTLEVDGGGGPIPLGGPRQRAVLAHLLIRANELVPAEALVDEIWGDAPPETARNTIQTYVSRLRIALGHDRIRTHAPGYSLRVDASELDAARFDSLMRDAKKALPVDPGIAVSTLDDALALWRGPALADLADQSSLLAEAARLDGLRLEAQEARIEGLLASGAEARAIGELEVLVARNPLRESLWGLLMLALYREGRQADALNTYQRLREILADELGIDPSPELARLHERVLKQDPGLDLRGEPLRGYRLLEKINDGPVGVVFRAIQPHVGRDVAVKVLSERVASDPEFVIRFERQAQAAASLEHPHIAPIYDYWREPGRAYVVSRYFRGGSLRALEERGETLEAERALRVVEQIASALAFAHRRDVAHGNVRSSNVLFDAEGNAYLGDFGIGVGPDADPADDIRDLAGLIRKVLPRNTALASLVEHAEVEGDLPDAGAIADAARTALDPLRVAAIRSVDERNPYKGLRAFIEADAGDFFGRGELSHRLIARLNEAGPGSRFLAVVGPSGCGKSSVVRAGLVPAIRQGALVNSKSTFIAEMFPGEHPIDELEAALLRIAVRPPSRFQDLLDSSSRGLLEAIDLIAPGESEVVLVVDQFEEVFTLTQDEREREVFLESLRVATADPESRLHVIITLRADFYDRPLVYPRFGELLAARTEAVPPLTPDELEQAIRVPAEQVGVRPEPGLVAEMIADVANQPGALPLLQYALTELFERRDDRNLTLPVYREIGGVAGALSARADRIYEATDPEGRRAIKQVFLRLITLGEGRQDTRRLVTRSELDSLEVDQEAIGGVLGAYGRHRLLTFDREPSTREPTVEIAHEAMLGTWQRLRIWIDDAREDLRQNQQLAYAAAEWRGSAQDPSFLLRGSRLEQFEAWLATSDLVVGQPERAYLKASIDLREEERAHEEARRAREARIERRSRTRMRALVAVFAVAALVAASLTVVATNQSERAELEATVAQARELAAASVANLEADPELSILLAKEAVDRTRSVDGSLLPEAEEALHRAVVASRIVNSIPGVGGLLAWSPRGVFVTEGPEGAGMIDIRDGETGTTVLSFEGHDGDINDVAFSPDGSKLATTGDDGRLKVWNPDTGALLASRSAGGEVWGPSFSADGSLVAGSWVRRGSQGATVRVLDLTSNADVVAAFRVAGAIDTAVSPDGERIAVMGFWNTKGGGVFDVKTGDRVFRLTAFNCCTFPDSRGVAWSPDGGTIATTNTDTVRVWDASTGRLRATLHGHTGPVFGVAWSPDSSRLVSGGSDGTARVWDIGAEGASELMSLSAKETQSGIVGVAFSRDGTRVMAGDADITAVKVWDVGPDGDAEWANIAWARWGWMVEFTPDGRGVVLAAQRSVSIWDPHTGRRLRTLGPATDGFWISSLDVSPDGGSIVLGGGDGSNNGFGGEATRSWNIRTGEELYSVEHDLDVLDVAFSPDGGHVVAGGWDGAAKIVDRSGNVVRVLNEDDTFVIHSVQFSPNGRLIAVAAAFGRGDPGTGRVKIWDWEQGALVRTIDRDAQRIAFDPSGSRIAMVSSEGLAEIWDVDTGMRVAELGGRSGGLNDVDYSTNGSLVATAGLDGTVRLFDGQTGSQRLVLRGSGCSVDEVAFSPDGNTLASTTCGGVRVWALDIDDLLEIARQNVTRTLTDEECQQYLHLDRCP
jgi:WD40 repeat protein/DNA-binding SARP family transcriptional activator/class 3 adenylate cyclase